MGFSYRTFDTVVTQLSQFQIPIAVIPFVLLNNKLQLNVQTLILMESSSVADKALGSVRDRRRILSRASDAFEINSLKNI